MAAIYNNASFIPLQPVPSQVFDISLSGQPCRVAIYQKTTGIYIDLYVSGIAILRGIACLNGNPIVIDSYLGFPGELAFWDYAGSNDPYFTGLGSRYQLVYYSP